MPTVRVHASSFARIADAFEVASRELNTLAEFALWILVALTILVTFTQVVFRYGLNSSLSWSEELSRYLFVWTIFIGASVASRRRQHILVEVLIVQFPTRLRGWADSLAVIISIVFFAIFAYVGCLLIQNAWQQYSTALEIRIAWVYAAAPLGAVLSILHFAAGLLQRWRGTGSGIPATTLGGIGELE
jgi:TRAP-type transport system small permease protein